MIGPALVRREEPVLPNGSEGRRRFAPPFAVVFGILARGHVDRGEQVEPAQSAAIKQTLPSPHWRPSSQLSFASTTPSPQKLTVGKQLLSQLSLSMRLPSSHSSLLARSRIALPQRGARQSPSQLSPFSKFPSSHSSPGSRPPLPQRPQKPVQKPVPSHSSPAATTSAMSASRTWNRRRTGSLSSPGSKFPRRRYRRA